MSDIKVLVVDDSAVMRHFLAEELSKLPGIDVVGTAVDAYIARNKILKFQPDVVTLDIQMPKMDGLTFLKKLMQYKPVPVIVFSSLTKKDADLALSALEAGAVDYIEKPSKPGEIGRTIQLLGKKIKQAAKANLGQNYQVESWQKGYKENGGQIIVAIGASTGGTVAIRKILKMLPQDFPPIVIVQHMPPIFTKAFADRLNADCEIEVKESTNRDQLYPGTALIAPGNYHMELARDKNGFFVTLNQKPLVHNQRPSVEVLFNSVERVAGRNAVGVILTGMGDDGARGLLNMKKAGAYTIAQDKASSVVFGMPNKAIKLGAVTKIAGLGEIPAILINHSHS